MHGERHPEEIENTGWTRGEGETGILRGHGRHPGIFPKEKQITVVDASTNKSSWLTPLLLNPSRIRGGGKVDDENPVGDVDYGVYQSTLLRKGWSW